MLKFGDTIRLSELDVELLRAATGFEPVEIGSVAELIEFVRLAKEHYPGETADCRRRRRSIDGAMKRLTEGESNSN
ncbi:hypothetical protein E4L96_20135 [Massilia arenosa]|uniref:Uncharacterized protein n=1 Tax=Zemynaea arenosa TaxID=2561931 RepID=A0A4Y9S1J0_9BURK|nr:hypothetical protein [Massilia arenosa]TFW13408.1 hypothetical protein E4L96_20135 [Massilia arenosa]